MSEPINLDALQAAYNVGASGAIMRLMPAIIAELRKARELLPHHCGDEVCTRPVEFDSVLCGCACDECSIAESMGIYAHEEVTPLNAWNTCYQCGQLVDCDDVHDGCEARCLGCSAVNVVVEGSDGSFWLVLAERDSDAGAEA